ncbi:MAG TPA: hypothetical protein VMY59_08875 [Candidatus Thermoplasmatota archaeon]|nr:hypothetical protein [Candidatus Thermoplasmatota archaeon]
MTSRRIRAGSAHAAKRKAKGKRITVTKVNYIPGTKKGRMKTYRVTTRKKIRHTSLGWHQDQVQHSRQKWERSYRKEHHIKK